MSKGLQALEHMNKNIILCEDIDEDVEIIKKELQALEIIKKHIVNRDSDTSGVYLEYCLGLFEPYYSIEIKHGVNQTITEKEYNLLKEVLADEP